MGQAPVVNRDSILVGLVSRADLLRPEHLPIVGNVQVWRNLLAQSVVDLMRTPVPSAAPDADIRRVASVLLDQRRGHSTTSCVTVPGAPRSVRCHF